MAITPSFPAWHQSQELSAGMSGAGAGQELDMIVRQNVSLVTASAACVSLHCAAPIADIMQHSGILLLHSQQHFQSNSDNTKINQDTYFDKF